ncbi:MAG: hypothetical protein ACERKZ_15825 [Lachnotalea sp.]
MKYLCEVSFTWKEGTIGFRKDLFVSRVADIIVCKIEADHLIKEVVLRMEMYIIYDTLGDECNHILVSQGN